MPQLSDQSICVDTSTEARKTVSFLKCRGYEVAARSTSSVRHADALVVRNVTPGCLHVNRIWARVTTTNGYTSLNWRVTLFPEAGSSMRNTTLGSTTHSY